MTSFFPRAVATREGMLMCAEALSTNTVAFGVKHISVRECRPRVYDVILVFGDLIHTPRASSESLRSPPHVSMTSRYLAGFCLAAGQLDLFFLSKSSFAPFESTQ